MKVIGQYLGLLTAAALVSTHEYDDIDLQMPLDYVKYPYQAMYPGDDTGKFLSRMFSTRRSRFAPQSLQTLYSLGSLHSQNFHGSNA